MVLDKTLGNGQYKNNANPLVLCHVQWPRRVDACVLSFLIREARWNLHGNTPTRIVQINRPEGVDTFSLLNLISDSARAGKLTAPGAVRSDTNCDGYGGATVIPSFQKSASPEEIVAQEHFGLQCVFCLVRMRCTESTRYALYGS